MAHFFAHHNHCPKCEGLLLDPEPTSFGEVARCLVCREDVAL
ncbi:hypothetical protein [Kineococcus sp. SYSU DK001]